MSCLVLGKAQLSSEWLSLMFEQQLREFSMLVF